MIIVRLPKNYLTRVLAENGFRRQIAPQGHSNSFILQSVTGRQGVACRHIILLALSLKILKKYRQKLPSSSTPLSFDAPAKRSPHEYPHKPYISIN